MPPIRRVPPQYVQLAEQFKELLVTGAVAPGEKLPAIREVMADPQFGRPGQNVVQAAYGLLRAWKLVRSDTTGTYANELPRAVLGPQQRRRLGTAPAEDVAVTAAGLVSCPEYVASILNLDGDSLVLRREQVLSLPGDDVPYMLMVTWMPPEYVLPVPELADPVPLPDYRGAAQLAADRAGFEIERGRTAFEARKAKDDGRELVHLQLTPGDYVLAGVWTWYGPDGMTEYTEFVVPVSRAVELDMAP
jgi:DNA-binding GntR family transcriptional regulator